VTHALVLLLAMLIGVVAGLRSMAAPAVVAWAAHLGWINLHGTWASWVATTSTVVVLTVLAVGELIADKLPKTPPRITVPSFATRFALGAFAGAVIGAAWHYTFSSLGAGVIGAVIGTLSGYHARRMLAAHNYGPDLPIAMLEDAIAILGGFVVLAATAHL